MMYDKANTADRHDDASPFQFQLCHLFLFVSLACIYFALVHATGEFVAALVIGVFVVRAVIVMLRIDGIMLSGIAGTCLAGTLLFCAGLAFGPEPSCPLFVGCLAYPAIGYTIGVLCAARRQLNYG